MDLPAEISRSILACHGDVELTLDGTPYPYQADAPLGLQDWSGKATFVCRPAAYLAMAARADRPATLRVASALAPADRLVLAGRLRLAQADTCESCDVVHEHVVLDPSSVLLLRGSSSTEIDPEDFADPDLQLNSGYLRRNEQHINSCHDHLLRDVVARRTGARAQDILAAQVAALKPDGVQLQWVTGAGAHTAELRFPAVSRSVLELALQLRRSLHPDLC